MAGKTISEETHRTEDARRVRLFVLVLLAVWSGLRLLFSYVFIPSLWGVDLFHYIPTWAAVALTGFSLAGIYFSSQLRPAAARQSKKNTQAAKTKRQRTSGSIILIAVVCGILFLAFQVAWPFLGDGTTYFGIMYQFQDSGILTTQRNATPVLYLLYGVYYIYLKFTHNRGFGFFPFTVVDLVSGLIFVVTSLKLAKVFDPDRWVRVVLFTLLTSLGGSLLFFGYVEMYPLQYAFVLVYAYYAFQYIHRKAKLSTVGIVAAFCIAFHLQNILLLPSFLFLFTLRGIEARANAGRQKIVRRLLLVSATVLIGTYIIASVTGLTSIEGSPFIPFSASGDSRYTLLSGMHVLDILNYHFLIAPVAVLIVCCCLIAGRSSIRWGNSFLLYLVVNLFFFEAFLIGGGLNLGLARDWDVCASLGITLALLAVVLLRQTVDAANVRRIALPIVTVAVSGIIGWVAINATVSSSISRYEDLLQQYAPIVEKKITSKGYENLRKFFQGVDGEAELSTIRKMIELYPNPADARQAMILVYRIIDALKASGSDAKGLTEVSKQDILAIADVIAAQSDSLLQLETFDKLRVAPPHSELATSLGDFFEDAVILLYTPTNILSLDEALRRCDDFITKHPMLPYGYEAKGYLLLSYTKESERTISYFEKAMSFDSLRTRPHLYLALAFDKVDRRKEAIMEFRRGLQLDSASKWGLVEYGIFLTRGLEDKTEIPYLEELRQMLMSAIDAPAQSSLQVEQHEHEVASAKELLQQVDSRLAELRSLR